MDASAQALLEHLIDYAGLFPPARLPLDESIRNYIRYRGEPEAWILARFICPAERLAELNPYIHDHFTEASPLLLSALSRGGETPESFLENLRNDLEAIARCVKQHGPTIAVENFETQLPANILSDGPDNLNRFLRAAADVFASQDIPPLTCFYEIPKSSDWSAVAHTLASLNQDTAAKTTRTAGRRGTLGLKLRCGGLEPTDVPSVAQVATALEACRGADVMLKFTAGLHHPTRRVDPALGVHVHGFLNLFAAGVFGAALDLDHPDLLAIIEEEDARQFTFTDEILAWTDAEATVNEIAHARRRYVTSFGSCSFDEPRDDLRELGYI